MENIKAENNKEESSDGSNLFGFNRETDKGEESEVDKSEESNENENSEAENEESLEDRRERIKAERESIREEMKERVHWDFDLDDFKNVAYLMRSSDHENRLNSGNMKHIIPDENGKDFFFYEQSCNANSQGKWNEKDLRERFGIVGASEWVKKEYPEDMKWVVRWLEYAKTTPQTEKVYESIDRNLENIKDYMKDWNGRHVPETGDSMKSTMNDQFYFIHCKDPRSAVYGLYRDGEKIDCRLYMCPQGDRQMELVDTFKQKCREKDRTFYFKFADECSFNDRFIIYTSYNDVDNYLGILNEISQEKPELFENMGKNPLWGRIDGAPKGVYFGEEPDQHARHYEKENESVFQKSYSSLRYDIFDIAFEKWTKEVFGEKSDSEYAEDTGRHFLDFNEKNPTTKMFSSPLEITDEQAKRFMEIFREELEINDIDPDNFCFDKEIDKKDDPKEENEGENDDSSEDNGSESDDFDEHSEENDEADVMSDEEFDKALRELGLI